MPDGTALDPLVAIWCGHVDSGFDGSLCHRADPEADGQAPITRQPRPDDVAGIQHLYGVPEPGLAGSLVAGAGSIAGWGRRAAARRWSAAAKARDESRGRFEPA
jgi:hypothetical protein